MWASNRTMWLLFLETMTVGICSTLLFVLDCHLWQAKPHIASPSLQSVRSANRRLTVCIDPGHPSEVGLGAQGKRTSEVRIAWQVALKVKKLLLQEKIKVILTKKREREFMTNRQRASIANHNHADLLVRLHCDAASDSGTATYFPDRPGVRAGIKGPSAAVIKASRACTEKFHPAMAQVLRGFLRDRGLHPDIETHIGRKQGALTGSIFSRVPVVLVEMCVLTNLHDEALLMTEKGQWLMANAVVKGINAALSSLPTK